VNARAGMDGNILGLISRKLVLTIGLPLAAGLDLQDFTGILAHELGHFAQGTAMRLTFIVRRVSFWFFRAVYERDSWDEQLDGAWRRSRYSVGYVLLGVAMLFIWAGR